jgi:very-short-patch-repair endonuclease
LSWKETAEWQRKTFKADAIRIASALARAKIDYSLEWVIPRYGEYRNGHPLSYVVDIMVLDEKYVPTAIEVEGEGSSSKDNDKRDAYLSTLGIRVLHVDNKTKGDQVIIRLNGSFRKQ